MDGYWLQLLERARIALRAFDEHDDVQQRFVAALMPRFRIEARLFEYVYAELPKDTQDADITRFPSSQRLQSRLGTHPAVEQLHAETGVTAWRERERTL